MLRAKRLHARRKHGGDGRGGMTVIVGDLRIGIPEGFAARPSLDSRIHICFRTYSETDGNIIVIPICLLLPVVARELSSTIAVTRS
jgi:hypothetical protein